MKRLGQHFLKNKSAIGKIVAALELKTGDTVIEIGPGHGELTDEVLGLRLEVLEKKNPGAPIKLNYIAIEKDIRLAEGLRKKFAEDKNIEIVEGDALKILPALSKTYHLKPITWKLIGNIPYYITGHLLRIVGELEKKPELCVFTIQKEVAERIVAAPPKMNRLAASVQFWTEPKIMGYISRKDFSPPPEVDSAIIKLNVKSEKLKVDSENYYKTVWRLFAQPRKTILSNLAAKKRSVRAEKEKIAEQLRGIGIVPEARPQDLTIQDIERISSLAL